MRKIFSVLALLLISGCANWQINQMASALPTQGPQSTLQRLEAIQPPQRDRAQYLLNLGLLKFYTGDLTGSQQDLQQAKTIMRDLQSISVTENLAATTTNETLRSYKGSPSERVLVHVVLALTYLAEGDLDGARVEMLQADVTMNELADDDSLLGQLASARFLAGLVYEMSGEWDDAMISYRRAYKIMKARAESVPQALASSLLNMAKRQGFDKEYEEYQAEFGVSAELAASDEAYWIAIYGDGVVSGKTESRLSVYDNDLGSMLTVVMPTYPPLHYQPRHLNLQVTQNKASVSTQHSGVIENIELRAREDLASQRVANLAAATLRAAAKYNMVENAKARGDFSGILVNIATVVSEQADIRSWNMLPSTLQIARGTMPLDGELTLTEYGQTITPPSTGEKYRLVITVNVMDRVFVYPPPQGESHEP